MSLCDSWGWWAKALRLTEVAGWLWHLDLVPVHIMGTRWMGNITVVLTSPFNLESSSRSPHCLSEFYGWLFYT